MLRRTGSLRVVATMVVAAAFLGVTAVPARADDVNDLQRRAARLADQIEQVGEEMDHLAEEYVVAIDEARQLDDDVEDSAAKVDALRLELDDFRVALRAFAVKTFASGGRGGGLGGLLGGSTQLEDTVVKEQYTELALNSGQEASDELESKMDQLRVAEARLAKQRDRKVKLVASLESKRAAAEDKQTELLALEQQNDADLAQALVAEQQRREAEAAARAVAEFEQIKAQAAAERAAAKSQSDSGSSSKSSPRKGGSSSSGSGGRGGGGGSSSGSNGASDGSSGGGSNSSGDSGSSGDGGGSGDGGSSGGGGGSGDGGGSGGSGSSGDSGSTGDGGGSGDGGSSGGDGGQSGGNGGDGGQSDGGSSGGGGRDVPPPSAGASGAMAAGKSQLGVAYRYAAAEPGVAFDCSGLTSWAWARAGVRMPHQSRAQYASFPHVPIADAQPGDLLFFHSPISHVGIYLGGGLIIHAIHGGTPVSISAVRWGKVVGVARPG